MHTKHCKLLLVSNLVTLKLFAIAIALILLQNKALGIWNLLMQKLDYQKCVIMLGFADQVTYLMEKLMYGQCLSPCICKHLNFFANENLDRLNVDCLTAQLQKQ